MKNGIWLLLFFSSSFLQAFELEDCKHYMPKNPVILDCGAHEGHSSIQLLQSFPDALVFAVEADPLIAQVLFTTYKEYPSIRPFNYGLSDTNGTIAFYTNVKSEGHSHQGSIFKQSPTTWYWDIHLENTPIVIPAKTLDTFCQENNIAKIDFLFLDMQGGELSMLKSSRHILPQVSVIYTEVLFEPIYEKAPLYQDMKSFLEESGFIEVKLIRYHPSWGDALFVKKDLLPL